MPCTQPISLSFRFDGREYPVHPLDMSWPDPDDPAQKTCIGAIQYTSSLGETGDLYVCIEVCETEADRAVFSDRLS